MSGWLIFRKLSRKKREALTIGISELSDIISSIKMVPIAVPELPTILFLRELRQLYKLVKHYLILELYIGLEVLVKIWAIGLNSIDWKVPCVRL
jgi:hypothetical protein